MRGHPDEWEIRREVERPGADVVAALARFPTTQIADAHPAVGVLAPAIRRLAGGWEACGPATTAWTRPGDLLFCLKAADLVEPGDVLVIDGGGREDAALLGDIVASVIVRRGGAGIVVDGAIRDPAGIDALGIPAFARATYPATQGIRGPGAVNVSIQCGGTLIEPGDVVRADASGIVVVPRALAPAVLEATIAVDEKERAWRAALEGGAGLGDALGLDEEIARRRAAGR